MPQKPKSVRPRRVGPDSGELKTIAEAVDEAKRIVVIAGAGISTAAGIPDFRSASGIYANGPLFERGACDDSRRAQLLRTALNYHDLAAAAEPTETHKWLASFKSRLHRLYTQNFDMLETKAGLEAGIGPRFKCAPIHGNNLKLKCGACHEAYDWQDHRRDIEAGTASGDEHSPRLPLPCPRCISRSEAKQEAWRKCRKIGQLRPSMVMLDEVHPQAEEIAGLVERDRRAHTDLLIVLGTSLKVYGPKKMLGRLSRPIRRRGGIVVYVNLSKPPSDCDKLIDYWVEWETDEWVRDMRRRQSEPSAGLSGTRACNLRRKNRSSTSRLTCTARSPPQDAAMKSKTPLSLGPMSLSPRQAHTTNISIDIEDVLGEIDEALHGEEDWEFPPARAVFALGKVRSSGNRESIEDLWLKVLRRKHAAQPGCCLGVDQTLLVT